MFMIVAHIHRILAKIFTWAGNRWNANDCGRGIQLSPDGLAISRNNNKDENAMLNTVRAVHAAFPPIQPNEPIQVCYFEAKCVKPVFMLGFCGAALPMDNHFYGRPNVFFLSYSGDGVGFPNAWRLDNTWFEAGDVIGCGMVKQAVSGKRCIFFTKKASVPIPLDASDQLFPAINIGPDEGDYFAETNFGLRPFMFKYKGNEEKLLNGFGDIEEAEEVNNNFSYEPKPVPDLVVDIY